MIVRTLITAAVAALAVGNAMAEDTETVLSMVEGSVLVNQSGTYETAKQGMALSAGDQVLLMEGASAQVSFAAGCVKALGANEILQVPENDLACLDDAAVYHQMGSGMGGIGLGELIGGGVIAVAGAAFIIDGDDEGFVPPPPPDSP